jgi:hypothetical protein
MKQFSDCIRWVLRHDPIVQIRVGEDSDNEYKVYDATNVKLNTQAPFIVWNFRETSQTEGVYGDDYALEYISLQVTSWGRTPNEAWDLADAADDALLLGDYSAEPWYLMKIRRDGIPRPHADLDTNWTQIDVFYQALFGR